MAPTIMLESKFGRIIRNKPQHAIMQRAIMIFLFTAGGSNWFNIFNGFSESSSLPSGGGRDGEWLGLSLAFPTGFFLA